tara:strand:- start:74 stop:406 length:333 start_codon:yes stop_codon:yes gene_type:complete
MSEQKYDSVLVGWADEPRYNDQGQLMSWSLRLKDHELKDMLDQYVTKRDEEGKGGNVYIKMFNSKSGKACASVYNPNSEPAKERRAQKAAALAAETSPNNAEGKNEGLPF